MLTGPVSRRLTPGGAVLLALLVIVGTAAAALAIPGPAGPITLAALAGLAVLWLATVAVITAVVMHRGRVADYRRLHAAAHPLYRRGECAAYLTIPEADR